LALLADIADEGGLTDPIALTLHVEVAGLAADLGRHDDAIDRWTRIAERAGDPFQRASALLAASRSAAAARRREAAWALLEQAAAVDVEDDVLELERIAQAATLELWMPLGEQPPTRDTAHAVGRQARELADAAGGVDALEARARRAYLDALRVEYDLAYQNDDAEGLLRTAAERATVARGFDDEGYLVASVDGGRALRRTARLAEAAQKLRHALDEGRRRVLPQVMIDAAYWLGTVLEQQARIAEADDVVVEAIELADRVGDEP